MKEYIGSAQPSPAGAEGIHLGPVGPIHLGPAGPIHLGPGPGPIWAHSRGFIWAHLSSFIWARAQGPFVPFYVFVTNGVKSKDGELSGTSL